MYKTETTEPFMASAVTPLRRLALQGKRCHALARWGLLAFAAMLCTGVAAQGAVTAVASPPVPTVATAPAVESRTAAETADQLTQTATLIARLRQQQAVVEAQAALAKANAELARINLSMAPAAPLIGEPQASPMAGLPGITRDNLRLLGVSGSPLQRVATLEMSDGVVRDVRAGQDVGNWRVQDVGLNAVVLMLRGRTPTRLTLRVDSQVREPAVAMPQASAQRPRKP